MTRQLLRIGLAIAIGWQGHSLYTTLTTPVVVAPVVDYPLQVVRGGRSPRMPRFPRLPKPKFMEVV